MNASIVGAGYVGLVTGACLASSGVRVLCCDTDENKITCLQKGRLPIYEPGLEEIILSCLHDSKTLEFTSDMKKTVDHAEIIFITVNTPTLEDNTCDLGNVTDVADKIALLMDSYKIIVDKSTVPVGTGRKMRDEIRRILDLRGSSLEFGIVSNPEFLREGSAVEDFKKPDRIVIGTDSEQAAGKVKSLYRPQIDAGVPVLVTGLETAEMIKYASNAFLAAKVSFINEIADICELCGADVSGVAEGMGMDGRIGPEFLKAGPGFGGSCFPKDLHALIGLSRRNGFAPLMLESIVETNRRQCEIMLNKIKSSLGGLKDRTVTILGISFKPDTDDIREAPSITVIGKLQEAGAHIRVYDPKAMQNLETQFPEFKAEYCRDTYTACSRSDCIILMTEWDEFHSLDFARLGNMVKEKIFLDLRNVYEPAYVKSFGFYYEGVGRK